MFIESILRKTISFFIKEKKVTLEEDPVNKFALELLCQIFSYLPLKDFVRASEVSKNWQAFINEKINDVRFKPLCLCSKSESVSWKMHYIQLENFKRRVATQNPQPLILQSVSEPFFLDYPMTSNYQALVCDQSNGMACFVFNEYVNYSFASLSKIEGHAFEIWDLNSNKVLKTLHSGQSEYKLENVVFGYPYLLTKTDKHLYIRDVSSDSDEPIHTLSQSSKNGKYFINKYGFISVINGQLCFYQINKDSEKGFKLDVCKYALAVAFNEECMPPISLLNDNNLIYEIAPGVLRVRDLSKENLPILIEELCPSEVMVKKDQLGGHSEFIATKSESFISSKVTSMVAHDKILVTLSKRNLLIWNLESAHLIKTFSRLDVNASILSDRSLELDAIAGHTVIAHTSSALHVLDISGEVVGSLKQWDKHYDYTICSNGYYQEKFYMLERNKKVDGYSRITLFDYSTKLTH